MFNSPNLKGLVFPQQQCYISRGVGLGWVYTGSGELRHGVISMQSRLGLEGRQRPAQSTSTVILRTKKQKHTQVNKPLEKQGDHTFHHQCSWLLNGLEVIVHAYYDYV